ncbi:hypothetical protein LINGRAHAP2_LOCUS12176 [Linum grandiflorum]
MKRTEKYYNDDLANKTQCILASKIPSQNSTRAQLEIGPYPELAINRIPPSSPGRRNSYCSPRRRRVPGRQDNPIADANSMSSTADSQSFVVQSTAYSTVTISDSKASSQDDDQIGDVNPSTAGSLYPSKKMKKEEFEKMEEEKEDDIDETDPCECCLKLETMKLELMPGDEVYGCNAEEYPDEHERLRLIYYLRSVDQSGGFYVDCPPPGFFGGIYNSAHFPFRRFHEKAKISAKHAITKYNDQEKKKLEFVRIKHVTGAPGGYTVFYLTLEALDPEIGENVTYQAVVSYSSIEECVKNVLIFREESTGEDLLEPAESFDERTKPKWRRKPENSGD